MDGGSEGHNLACEKSSFYAFFVFFRFHFFRFCCSHWRFKDRRKDFSIPVKRERENGLMGGYDDEKVSTRRWNTMACP